MTAISWLVFQLSDSAFVLGLVNFLRQSPLILLGITGGWMADNFDRKKILIWTKVMMAVQALIMGVLTVYGVIELWQVLILATLLGVTNALDMPAKQALTYNLVRKSDLVNAVSLNTSSFHASRSVGPVLAVFVVSMFSSPQGEGVCFLLNAASYIMVIWALCRVDIKSAVAKKKGDEPPARMQEAFAFLSKNDEVRRTVILGAISSLLCMQYLVLMPVFAKDVLNREIDGFGILMSGAAVGSFSAAMLLANRGSAGMALLRGITTATLGFSICLIMFSFSTNFYLSIILATGIGFCSTMQLSASNSLIQLEVSDEMRGRVLSLWMINIAGLGPLGGLLIGWIASVYGAPITMATCGGIAFLCASLFLLVKRSNRSQYTQTV